MTYKEKYQELVKFSRSDDAKIKQKANNWLISIGLHGAAELRVSTFLIELAIRNLKDEVTHDEFSQLLNANCTKMPKNETTRSRRLDGDYKIIPPQFSKNKGY